MTETDLKHEWADGHSLNGKRVSIVFPFTTGTHGGLKLTMSPLVQ